MPAPSARGAPQIGRVGQGEEIARLQRRVGIEARVDLGSFRTRQKEQRQQSAHSRSIVAAVNRVHVLFLLLACVRPVAPEQAPDEQLFQSAELSRTPNAEVRRLLSSPSAPVRTRTK